MSTKETVREAIIRANPKIICEEVFTFKKGKNWFFAYTDSNGLNQHSPLFATKRLALGHAYGYGFYKSRPITLADVLLAIWSIKKTWQIFGLSEKGFILSQNEDTENTYIWNLTKPYDDQSQELFDFLAKVLGVENK